MYAIVAAAAAAAVRIAARSHSSKIWRILKNHPPLHIISFKKFQTLMMYKLDAITFRTLVHAVQS
jgi:hypothetical protein